MISIGINLILGLMLFCAMMLGLRLEKRLRALKDSHLDFAKAVAELDQASVRTEQSLAVFRAGTEDARGELAARIDQARLACQRLEQLTAAAEQALNQPLPLRQALASAPHTAAAPVALHPAVASSVAAEPVMLRSEAARTVQSMQPAARSRARVDDDLFELGAPRERRTAGARW